MSLHHLSHLNGLWDDSDFKGLGLSGATFGGLGLSALMFLKNIGLLKYDFDGDVMNKNQRKLKQKTSIIDIVSLKYALI